MPQKEIFPGWLPIQIAKHYGFPLDLDGSGQSVAIISLGGKIDRKELETDFKAMRVPMPTINLIDLPGISAEQDKMGTGETHLDIEVIGNICPKATINVYRGSNPTGFAAAVNKAIDDKNGVISISWGGDEYEGADRTDLEEAFLKAQENNVTVCVATGDGGSANRRHWGEAIGASDNLARVQYPASSPLVLACGGTELMVEDGKYSEVVWNNSVHKGGSTGGGVSTVFNVPTWQNGLALKSANPQGKVGRTIPDVAGLAAYGYGQTADWKIFQDGQAVPNGGTSAVAPLWAAFLILVNEKRIQANKGTLGFINEHLYAMAHEMTLFNDITSGNNRPTADYPGYDATEGFDACTGWGTPIGAALTTALVDLP